MYLAPDVSEQTCDSTAIRDRLISVENARARITATVGPVAETETVPLASGLGRVLAAPVRARAAIPPFDNAAMDGYAVSTKALIGQGPWRMPVVARVPAGAEPPVSPRLGAIRVFTGAPVPNGLDAVVMQETVEVRNGDLELRQRPGIGQHLRRAGEIASSGTELLPPGRCLGQRDIALAAAAGAETLPVRRQLKAALVISGDEVRQPAATGSASTIHDINGPMFRTILNRAGVDLTVLDYVADDRRKTQRRLAELAQDVDLLVTTGGISVGDEDHVKPAMAALGVRMLFSGVALKPGKPVCLGQLGPTLWLGLPGNPVSAFVTWELFGTALLSRLQGIAAAPARTLRVRSHETLRHRKGRTEYRLARLNRAERDGLITVTCPHGAQTSHVTALAAADGLVCLPSAIGDIQAGSELLFQPFSAGD